jgi:hypothetical protein
MTIPSTGRPIVRAMAMPATLVLTVVTFFVTWGWLRTSENRALRALEPSIRRELFVRTRQEVDILCREPKFRDACLERAEFLLAFPECDERCQAFVHRYQSPATR